LKIHCNVTLPCTLRSFTLYFSCTFPPQPPHAKYMHWRLGAFGKLQKAAISIMKSVRPRGRTRLPLDGFSRSLIFE
jgi:hypothetical protein